VRTDRKSTAIAGLSMGGAQTLELAARRMQDFGYVGVLSSGVFGIAQSNDWETRYKSELDESHAKAGPALLRFATGNDDFLLDTPKATVAMFERHGFKPVYRRERQRPYLDQLARVSARARAAALQMMRRLGVTHRWCRTPPVAVGESSITSSEGPCANKS
jgi:pimeloyl-ACP methyl ester carboxylesterase